MINNQDALLLLERLANQIGLLREKQNPDGDFYQWYLEVLSAIERIFGTDSDELKEFQQISFEVDPRLLDRVRELFALPSDTVIPQDDYYHRRLIEAAEFLLTRIISLRQRRQ